MLTPHITNAVTRLLIQMAHLLMWQLNNLKLEAAATVSLDSEVLLPDQNTDIYCHSFVMSSLCEK